jgi:hypothetical protein
LIRAWRNKTTVINMLAVAVLGRRAELAESKDERVATMVSLGIRDRAFGKPKDYDPREDRQPVRIDLTRLTPDQLAPLRIMIDSGAIRPAVLEVDEAGEKPNLEGCVPIQTWRTR